MAQQEIRVCHLYGNLLNTYGDNGNLLLLKHYAKQQGIHFTSEIISLQQEFVPANYDFVFIGGGQDYEQLIVSRDIQNKKTALSQFIENHGVVLAICGGFQLLGHYYIGADGEKIAGIGALDHYTLSQKDQRFIGDIDIENKPFNEHYSGFENHNGMTYLGPELAPLGIVKTGFGNNGADKTEGALYKNTFCSYLHGPLLARNEHLAKRLIALILKQKDGTDH